MLINKLSGAFDGGFINRAKADIVNNKTNKKPKARSQASGRRGPRGQSRFKGVCITRAGKWRAVIYVGRKQVLNAPYYDSNLNLTGF